MSSFLTQKSQAQLATSSLKYTPNFPNGDKETPTKLASLALQRLRAVDPWSFSEEKTQPSVPDPFQPFSSTSDVTLKSQEKPYIQSAMCYLGTDRVAGSKETPNVYRFSGVYPAPLADCVKFYESISTQKKPDINPSLLEYTLTEDLETAKLDEMQAALQKQGETVCTSVRRAYYLHWCSKRPTDKHSDLDFMDFFVDFKTTKGNRVLVAVAAPHNKEPPNTKYRRAENEVRCVYLRPDPTNEKNTLFTWSVSVHFQNMSHELFQDIACAFVKTLNCHGDYLASTSK